MPRGGDFINLFELFGTIGLKDEGFVTGIKNATNEGESFGSKFKNVADGVGKAAIAISGVAIGVGTSLFGLASKASDAASRVNDMSQVLGISNKGFQEWDYILSQNGQSIDSFGVGMKTLQQKMNGLSEDGKPAQELFTQLGLSFDEVKAATPEEAMEMVIKKLQAMPPGANKTALALQAFGKQGMALGPILNMTAEETENMRQRANELGLVLSDDAIAAGDDFGDMMDDLKGAIGGVVNKIGIDLMPTITKVVEKIISGISQVSPIIQGVVGFLADHLGTIVLFAGGVTALALAFKGMMLVENITKLLTEWGVITAFTTLQTQLQTTSLFELIAVKAKDFAETAALSAMYAKDFVVGLANSTAELAKQAVQFASNTVAKIADTVATWSAAAAAEGISLAHYALNLALASTAVQWIKSTAVKIADTVATIALSAATGIATAAQWLWNAAMSANPIGLIIIAIAGFIAGMVALVKWLTKSKTEQEDLSKSTDNLKESQNQLTETYSETEKAIESYAKVTTDMFSKINTESEISVQDMITNLRENQQAVKDWSHNLEVLAKRGIDDGLLQSLKDAGPESAKYVREIKNSTDIELQALSNAFAKGGSDSIEGYIQGMEQTVSGRGSGGRIGNVTDTIKDEFWKKGMRGGSPSKVFEEYGKFSMEGFINGIISMIEKVKATMKNIADTVSGTLKNVLGIHSPSTIFANFGQNTVQGFINGMSGMSSQINNAVDNIFGNLGGEVDYTAALSINGSKSNFNGNTTSSSPVATSSAQGGNTYILQVKMDDIDEVYKLKDVFTDFSFNQTVFEGVR